MGLGCTEPGRSFAVAHDHEYRIGESLIGAVDLVRVRVRVRVGFGVGGRVRAGVRVRVRVRVRV